jgi:energy-coupling factor transport system permease protein
LNQNISLGQYFPGSSPIHRIDPRTKIVVSLSFMAAAMAAATPPEFALLAVFAVCVVAASRIPASMVLRSVKPVIPLIIFAGAINIFLVKGRPIFRLWAIAPTYEGLSLALAMSARISLILIGGSSMMIFTTTPIMLTDGLERLLKPLKRAKVPVHEISMMMAIALRFIPTLMEEADKIIKAQASRGADFNEGKLLDRARSFIPIIIPLFVSAFRRADELANAMEARCYRGDEGRTRLRVLRMTRLDACAFAAFGICMALFALLKLGAAPWWGRA